MVALVIHVRIATELTADEFGPHEFFVERFTLPEDFAKDATDAHARLLTLIATTRYFELEGSTGTIPLSTHTIRSVALWDG